MHRMWSFLQSEAKGVNFTGYSYALRLSTMVPPGSRVFLLTRRYWIRHFESNHVCVFEKVARQVDCNRKGNWRERLFRNKQLRRYPPDSRNTRQSRVETKLERFFAKFVDVLRSYCSCTEVFLVIDKNMFVVVTIYYILERSGVTQLKLFRWHCNIDTLTIQ